MQCLAAVFGPVKATGPPKRSCVCRMVRDVLERNGNMSAYSKEDILKLVKEEDVEFIRLQFTDMFGNLKNRAITASQLEKALENRCTFDGSSIEGFSGIEEADLYLHPDIDTMEIFPWRPQQGKVARLICDVYRPNGEPFPGDSRYILKRTLKKAEKMGYTFQVGPECEFFLFHLDENAMPTTISHEQAGYLDVAPLDLGENARRDMVLTLEDMGFVVESSHHETAPAQHEIDFEYAEALKAADDIVTFKMTVKAIAKRHGLHATFMPKPRAGVNGSGMHVNMSLCRDGKNIFCDPSDEHGLSREAYCFIGGILQHIRAITAITNPLVNSYKRLIPGYEAPAYIAWSTSSRSPLIRIPSSRGEETRIELRSPDPAANPYLSLAVCLQAGLDGIINGTKPPKSVDCNILALNEAERGLLGIERLPGSLLEAIAQLEQDALIREALGEHVSNRYIDAKREEWNRYCAQITDWEINEYLYRF